jgi:hypothetical protein
MEDEDTKAESSVGGNAAGLKEKLQNIDFKDKKVLGGIGAIALVIIIIIYLVFFSGGSASVEEGKEAAIDITTIDRAKAYIILLSSADAKPAPFMSTIRSDDRALQFSMYLGINQEAAPEEFNIAMTPLCSVVLRFLSTKSQGEILEIIQDPDETGKTLLISQLNKVLRRRGLTGDKVKVVEVQFTKYFFPNI